MTALVPLRAARARMKHQRHRQRLMMAKLLDPCSISWPRHREGPEPAHNRTFVTGPRLLK